jgi:mono/diheme cytochrome c family protein
MTTHLRLLSVSGVLFTVVIASVVSNRDPLRIAPVTAAQATQGTYKSVYDGWKWWHVYCYRCHGVDAIGTTNAPSLIDPNRKLSSAAFLKIVMNGVPDKGMQAWDKLLDKKQVSEIHLYVRARTDKVLPPGRPDEVGPNGKAWVPPTGWPGKLGP